MSLYPFPSLTNEENMLNFFARINYLWAFRFIGHLDLISHKGNHASIFYPLQQVAEKKNV